MLRILRNMPREIASRSPAAAPPVRALRCTQALARLLHWIWSALRKRGSGPGARLCAVLRLFFEISFFWVFSNGGPGRARTCDLQIRSLTL
jgi:hypothetical protein